MLDSNHPVLSISLLKKYCFHINDIMSFSEMNPMQFTFNYTVFHLLMHLGRLEFDILCQILLGQMRFQQSYPGN